MKFPINDPHINLDDNIDESINELIKAVLQGLYQPMHVRLSPTTKKLLIRLPNGTTRADLEAMKIDIEAMLKINTSDQVRGVIITIDGQGTQYDFISRYVVVVSSGRPREWLSPHPTKIAFDCTSYREGLFQCCKIFCVSSGYSDL